MNAIEWLFRLTDVNYRNILSKAPVSSPISEAPSGELARPVVVKYIGTKNMCDDLRDNYELKTLLGRPMRDPPKINALPSNFENTTLTQSVSVGFCMSPEYAAALRRESDLQFKSKFLAPK